jgi:hypothetical protein
MRFCHRLLLASLLAAAALAQPSGGPYGPIDQRYEIPKAAHVYFVAPDGKADAAGTALDQPTTIETAMDRVATGDAIVLRGGIYRTGGLVLNQGISMQPYLEERPVLQGTEVATCAATSGAPRGRNSSQRGRSAGGSAAARGCGRRCTASITTWCSLMASC